VNAHASLRKAVEIVKHGGLIIAPTDSVYGLFCNALDEKAVSRVKFVKSRERDKPLQIAVRKNDAWQYGVITRDAEALMERFWPGNVNIIVQKKNTVPDYVSKETVCMTCHANDIARRLVALSGLPLVSTSANFSGEAAPTNAGEVSKELIELVDIVLDAGETKNKKLNTIVDASKTPAVVVREGSVGRTELESVIRLA